MKNKIIQHAEETFKLCKLVNILLLQYLVKQYLNIVKLISEISVEIINCWKPHTQGQTMQKKNESKFKTE